MGNVRHVFKWDIKKGIWTETSEKDARKGKALTLVDFGNIIHDKNKGLNYIIIADGCRLDNHSRDGETVDADKIGITNVINYFEKRNQNYRIGLWLVDQDAPLKEQSRMTASLISSIAEKEYTITVNFIGLSKCGLIAFDMAKYLVSPEARSKTRIYSVSAPYKGALVAGPLLFQEQVSKLVTARIGQNAMSQKVVDEIMHYYYDKHSCSHMELDISLPEGIPKGFLNYYDSSFLENIFQERNIVGSNRVVHFENICTKIGDDTFKETMRAGNFDELGMFILDKLIYGGASDGLVSLESQQEFDSRVPKMPKSRIITSTHHILKTPVYANQLLEVVDDNMEAKRLSLM